MESLEDMEQTITKKKRDSRSKARRALKETEDELKKHTEEKEKTVRVVFYRRLIRMMLKNDVKAQKSFLEKHPEALTAEIDDFGNTIFHFIVQQPTNKATIELLKEFVPKVSAETLGKKNVNNLTACHVAACAGYTEALQVFADRYPCLLKIIDDVDKKWLPIHHAASWRREETVRYLLSKTDLQADHQNSNLDHWFDCGLLLDLLVESNLPGLALRLLKQHLHLVRPDENSRWRNTVNKLAKKSLAFKSGRKLGILESLIYFVIPVNDDDQEHGASCHFGNDIEEQITVSTDHSNGIHQIDTIVPCWRIHKQKKEHSQTLELVRTMISEVVWTYNGATIIWFAVIPVNDDDQEHGASCHFGNDIEKQITVCTDHSKGIHQIATIVPCWRIHKQKKEHSQTLELVRTMISEVVWTYNGAVEYLKEPVLTAARLGIHEFVEEVLKAYPNSVLFKDDEGRNIFLLAVLHRKENVFRLIYDQMASIKDHTNYLHDIYDYNILHLAGKMLTAPSQVPGAALQMQRELQWFTGIEDFSQTWLQEQQNEDDLTPRELFTKEHRNLIEKGEKWMRDTATSCSVVGALIITIVFAAAFTVPGGSNNNGVPNYLNEAYFRIFAISVALALFASTTSVQIFLGMLTSRYAEKDFLRALPNKLIIGLATLFWSSTSMMVAFGAAFCILLSHPWKWVIILVCLLGCIPVTLFAWMQFPLLVDIIRSTYGPSILKEKKCLRIMRMLKY